jgi:cytochrome b
MWREAGHNPMGGWSATLLLLALALQTLSGLFSETSDGLEEGPLSRLANDDIVQAATKLHEISFAFLVLLIALHLLAVAFYTLFKRQNLATAMVHGYRLLPAPSIPLRPARLRAAILATALAIASVAAVATYRRFSRDSRTLPRSPSCYRRSSISSVRHGIAISFLYAVVRETDDRRPPSSRVKVRNTCGLV